MDGDPIFIDVTPNGDSTYNMTIFRHDTLQSLQPAVCQDLAQTETSTRPDDASVVENQKTTAPKEDDGYPTTIQKRKHRCPECKRFTTETEEKLLRHIKKVHRGENPFSCYMCDYSTYNKCLFEEHVRIHQGIKPFKCSHCPYKSVSKKNVKKHELIHRPDNPLKCGKCGFIARHTKSLKCHQASCDGNSSDTVKCEQCDYVTNRTHMVYHKRSHDSGTYSCAKCDYTVKSKRLLRTHELKKHSQKRVIKKVVKNSSKSFKCKVCGWQSTHKPKTLLHLIHHPEQDVNEDVIDVSILRNFGIMK